MFPELAVKSESHQTSFTLRRTLFTCIHDRHTFNFVPYKSFPRVKKYAVKWNRVFTKNLEVTENAIQEPRRKVYNKVWSVSAAVSTRVTDRCATLQINTIHTFPPVTEVCCYWITKTKWRWNAENLVARSTSYLSLSPPSFLRTEQNTFFSNLFLHLKEAMLRQKLHFFPVINGFHEQDQGKKQNTEARSTKVNLEQVLCWHDIIIIWFQQNDVTTAHTHTIVLFTFWIPIDRFRFQVAS